ncbi:hypothetical protein SAMN05518672_1062 [Chitinophaga sp. CF118]|uniref:hypothetical protein n=1 Tax=Chitinophaga sp. CF118 TaxID=1884367 RepID=UPI0008EA8704|nr:hypothetical protein [Chitinophaga sp. CF118]SFE39939.1 hypothetical protein SAMN05518672_1062 [Chitinophaga sp. CF118]
MSKYKNEHLDCVLKSHKIENNETLMIAYRAKRDEVREQLKAKYAGRIYRVLHSGSYKKFTGINIKFDMDLVIPFRRNEAGTLEELYNELFTYFNEEYGKIDSSLRSVKRQKVAIGLEFYVDGEILDLDIVPGREIGDYEKDGDLNLYLNNINGEKGATLKTNIQKQIDNISGNSEARDVIKLLKVYKRQNNEAIKSFVIELMVVRALIGYKGDGNIWSKLKHTMTYFKDYMTTARLVDPGNQNNIVSDSLSAIQKEAIASRFSNVLQQIESDEALLKVYFAVNTKYPCEPKRSAYVVNDNTRADTLNNEDFG